MNIHRVHISSKKSNFFYQLNHPLDVASVSITDVQIPLTYYNIPEGSSLTLGVDGFEQVYTPQPGNYSADDLMTELNRVLTSQVATVSYSKITGLTSITAAENTTITLSISALSEKLGFTKNITTAAPILLSDSTISLTSDTLYIVSDIPTKAELDSKSISILYKANIANAPFTIFTDNNREAVQHPLDPVQKLSRVHFRVVNYNLEEVVFYGGHLEFTLNLFTITRDMS